MKVLTEENAKTAKTVRNIANPEWGTKRFNYNNQPLLDGEYASTVGVGSSSSVLYKSEYKFWEIVS